MPVRSFAEEAGVDGIFFPFLKLFLIELPV